jgi:hypothetical protein
MARHRRRFHPIGRNARRLRRAIRGGAA